MNKPAEIDINDSHQPASSPAALAKAVREFVDAWVIPNELQLSQQLEARDNSLLLDLIDRAKSAGLRGLFYPLAYGGKVPSLEQYMDVAEQEGRSEFGPAVFASYSALDAHMLAAWGSAHIREQFLVPLAEGRALPSYGMTEPDRAGSVPARIATTAQLDGQVWRIQGRKSYISHVERASFMTVLARTDPEANPQQALSMIIVPTSSEGFTMEQRISMLGRTESQWEVSFNQVEVPQANLLGELGQGLTLMGRRLGIGRLLRSAHWLGLAQRCFDLMAQRIQSPRGCATQLADKQLIRKLVFDSYQAILNARMLTRYAARLVDRQEDFSIAVNTAKYQAAQTLSLVADNAVQVYGAEGVSDFCPLSSIYRMARTTRILDGADEPLISAVGRQLLEHFQTCDSFSFADSTAL